MNRAGILAKSAQPDNSTMIRRLIRPGIPES